MTVSRMEDKSVPKEFHNNNQSKKKRVEDLARDAEKKLREQPGKITEQIFLDKTKEVDPEGKGISRATLYRNEVVHKIFIDLKESRERKVRKPRSTRPSQSKRSKAKELRDKYSGRSKLSLIEELEENNQTIEKLEKRLAECTKELTILRQQNTNQMVLLTKLQQEKLQQ